MRKIFLTILVALLGACGGWSAAQAQKPVVRAVLFYAATCPHCQFVLQNTLPPLQQKYGSQLEISLYEVYDPANYELWLSAVEIYQISYEAAGVPMLFIGDNVLIGSDEIPERLPGLIEEYLATSGVDISKIPGLIVQPSPAPAPTAVSVEPLATPTPTP
jgi:glutaredoxin